MIEFDAQKEHLDISKFPYEAFYTFFNDYDSSKQDVLLSLITTFNLNIDSVVLQAVDSCTEQPLEYILSLAVTNNIQVNMNTLYSIAIILIRPNIVSFILSLNTPLPIYDTIKHMSNANLDNDIKDKLFSRSKKDKTRAMYDIIDIIKGDYKEILNNPAIASGMRDLYKNKDSKVFFNILLIYINNREVLIRIFTKILEDYRPGHGLHYHKESYVTEILNKDYVTPDIIYRIVAQGGESLFKSVDIIISTFFRKVDKKDVNNINAFIDLIRRHFDYKDDLIASFYNENLLQQRSSTTGIVEIPELYEEPLHSSDDSSSEYYNSDTSDEST